MHVVGRKSTSSEQSGDATELPPQTGELGHYLARDGSAGAVVGLDVDRPHAGLIVGKRGAGKSHTLGVFAEATARARGVAPVVVDPMGVFTGLAAETRSGRTIEAQVLEAPRITADALSPDKWPALVGLDPASGPGTLVWDAAASASTLTGMVDCLTDLDAAPEFRRAARNHLHRAQKWGIFAQDGLTAADLFGPEATVLSLAGVADAPTSAVVAAVAGLLYDARTGPEPPPRLPWLFVDEAHVAVDGVAKTALREILTRGRAPGVSLVLATQRPSALPAVAASQADLLIAHQLTSGADIDALAAASPTYLSGTLRERLPTGRGEVLVVDDATESTHTVRIRARQTPHGGQTPRASTVSESARREERETDRCERPKRKL